MDVRGKKNVKRTQNFSLRKKKYGDCMGDLDVGRKGR